MAEIAVSLVGNLIAGISALVEKEATLLQSVPENTRFIKDELQTIGAFLGVVENMKENSPKHHMARIWAEQVKDLAYDMEDCLEEQITALTTHQSSSWSQYLTNYRTLRRFAARLSDLRSRIDEASERNMRYHLIAADQPMIDPTNFMMALDNLLSRSVKSSTKKVTTDDLKKKVVPWDEAHKATVSNDETKTPDVVAIVGMCGSGKTTFVREIYEDEKTTGNFESRIWITVSQDVNVAEVFMDMIVQLSDGSSSQAEYTGEEDKLAHHIRDKLEQKQFLVVFDDLWTKHDWLSIKRALPQVCKSGSRIFVTTEIVHVMGKTMAKLLASESPHKWGKLCDDFPSLLYNHPNLEDTRKVMIKRYKCLPPCLKPCFLYLSIFPEKYDINVATLIDRWLAEGLVRDTTGNPRDTAGRYLSELFDRSLVRVSKLRRNRSCKTCRIHPMMRDILVKISQEEKVSITISPRKSSNLPVKRVPHVAFDVQSGRKLARCVELSGVRSLTVFNEPSESIGALICASQLRALRVLDLSNANFQITRRDVGRVGELCHLRYLNLYRSQICELPSSIGKLTFLRLLNVRKTGITKLPSEVTQLSSLQSLRASRRTQDSCHNRRNRCCRDSGVDAPKGIENLQDIEQLDIVDIKDSSSSKIEALGKLARLKHLGLTGITMENGKMVSTVLEKISSSLTYLYLGACRNDGTLACLLISEKKTKGEKKEKGSLEFPCLQSIKLDGHIGKTPYWISNSLTLAVIKIYRTNLQQSDIMSLERLPCLVTLALLDNSYISDTLVFYAKAFRTLKTLEIFRLPKLKRVIFTEEAVLELRSLAIRCCTLRVEGKKNLKKLWDGHLDNGVEVV